jgi:hypothetical protein
VPGLALALAGAFLATTQVSCSGRLLGLFLLRSERGRPFELKDDLKLGEEERLLGGLGFAAVRRRLGSPRLGRPRLEVAWDREDGSGYVGNVLADGRTLETVFGRYLHDDGREVHGLFVGGAQPDAILDLALEESGMSLRDARGWHHLWCTVNEAIRLEGDDRLYHPPDWRLVDSRVLVDTPERVILASQHRLEAGGAGLAMHRLAHFQAGQPWVRLGVRFTNVGERAVTLTYGYGDEPWVGRFGSADGNVGWVRGGLVPVARRLDLRLERWAGIADAKSGFANFIAWPASDPDLAYFNNHGGPPTRQEAGAPLSSNEVYVGLEWQRRRLEPGQALSIQLVIGLAATAPGQEPAIPDGAVPSPYASARAP